jgi:hypothetical protein
MTDNPLLAEFQPKPKRAEPRPTEPLWTLVKGGERQSAALLPQDGSAVELQQSGTVNGSTAIGMNLATSRCSRLRTRGESSSVMDGSHWKACHDSDDRTR